MELTGPIVLPAARKTVFSWMSSAANPFFYGKHCYILSFDRSLGEHNWSIQWKQSSRLSIKVKNVHHDYVEGLSLVLNDKEHLYPAGDSPEDRIYVGDFRHPENWPVCLKISSIIRTRATGLSENHYQLHIEIRKLRWK